jgi:hypothetical protein
MSIFDSKPYQLIEFYAYQVTIACWSVLLYNAVLEPDWLEICISIICILASCETIRGMTKKQTEGG